MRKASNRAFRLRSAKDWITTYSGENVVKAYSKKYAVDKICAVKELRLIGIEISEEYEYQLRKSLEALREQRLLLKEKRESVLYAMSDFESDESFAMILGYTSGGFPYGVTHEDMEELNQGGEEIGLYALSVIDMQGKCLV